MHAELERAAERWKTAPEPPRCDQLDDASDRANCARIASALAPLTRSAPDATPVARRLAELAELALTCERTLGRLQYLALGAIGEKRLGNQLGPLRRPGPLPAVVPGPSGKPLGLAAPKLALADNPFLPALRSSAALERLALGELGAYLEYAALPTRRQALETCAGLVEAHGHFPMLGHLLEEAFVLERDPAQKARLGQLKVRIFPEPPERSP